MLPRRRNAQTQASGEAEGRQEAHAPVRQGGHPAGGVHCGAEGGCVSTADEADLRSGQEYRLPSPAAARRRGDTIRISDEMNIDIAQDGSVYGIELLNANAQLRSADGGKLVLVDEVETREVELSLGAM